MIELRVLGPPRIDVSNGPPPASVVRQPRRVALLAYLAAATPRGPHRRDKLLAVFWPESDASHARAALNQALYVLRSRLGEVFVGTGGDQVALDRGAVWCDAAAFEESLDAGRPEEALALYRGDLLDGFFVADAPAFERWVDEERLRLRQRASEGAWALAEARAADGRVLEAQRWARRAAELLPADEAVVRRLMLFLRGLGDRAAAIGAYEAFVWRLAQEYELEPSAETSALAAAIRAEERSVAPPSLAEVPAPVRGRIEAAVPSGGWRWPLAVLAIVGMAGVAGIWGSSRETTREADAWISLLDVADAPPLAEGLAGTTIAVSSDRHIAYVGRGEQGRQLYLKRSDRARATPIPNTAGALQPFFSPDGAWIGYVVANTIRKVRLSGGRSVEVYRGRTAVQGASWGDDDGIVFALRDGLFRIPATGGEPEPVALSDSTRPEWYRWPDVLPGSRVALFTTVRESGSELSAVSLESGAVRALGVRGGSPRFVPPGFLVWARLDGALLAAPFDAKSLQLRGPPTSVVEDVHVGMSLDAKLGVSSEALAYVPFRPGNALVVVDTTGREQVVAVNTVGFEGPEFSADGRHVVAALRFPDSRLADIWIVDLATHDLRRVTHDSGSFGPVVSSTLPMRIAVASKPGGRGYGFGIRLLPEDSAAPAEALLAPEVGQRPRDFTPDGGALVFQRRDTVTLDDIWVAPLDGAGTPMPYLRGRANERAPAVSPTGRWIAFVSDQSGRDEVYLGEFPALREAVKISEAGGREPRWALGGRALFYRTDRGMTRVEIVADSTLAVGQRRVLFDDAAYVKSAQSAAYDVHPDGTRFVMLRRTEDRGDLLLWLGRLESPR